MLVVAVCAAGATPAAAQPAPEPGADDPSASVPVVAVLVDDFDWSRAPEQLGQWARASSAMRTATSTVLGADAWLSIGKGGRSRSLGWARRVGLVSTVPGGFVAEEWDALEAADRRSGYEGYPGSFGEALKELGAGFEFVTDRPSTAVIVADRSGQVARGRLGGAAEVGASLAAGAEVVVASTSNPDTVPAFLAVADGTCVVVASSSSPEEAMHLGVLATSPECELGDDGLRSSSTRKDGYVAVIDVAPTVLTLAGLPVPSSMIGHPVEPSAGVSLAALVEQDRVARRAVAVGPSFVFVFICVFVAAAAVTLWRRRLPHAASMWLASVPLGSFLISLVPWWDHGPWMAPLAAGGFAAVVAAVASVGAGAFARGSRHVALAVVAASTAAVLAADAAFGGSLQFNNPLGNSPINAGRFSGMGNVAFGFVLAGAVVAAAVALGRHGTRALPWVLLGSALVVAADGSPSLGADVGGVLALVPALGIVVTCYRTGGLPLRRLAMLGAGAAVLLALFALYDLAQPKGSQTHLAGWLSGENPAGALSRKLDAMLGSFERSRLRWFPILPLLVLIRERRRFWTTGWLRAAMLGLGAGAVVGTLVNDSGVGVLAAVLAVGWPLAMGLAEPEALDAPVPAEAPVPTPG